MDWITCPSLSCSYAGLVVQGVVLRVHVFGLEHFCNIACTVDLLGLVRHLQDTENIINIMTCKPTVAGWMTSLGAYRVHGNVKMEEQIAKQVVKLAPGSSWGCGLLSNVYAAAEGSQCKEV